jgi:hypothetical protein
MQPHPYVHRDDMKAAAKAYREQKGGHFVRRDGTVTEKEMAKYSAHTQTKEEISAALWRWVADCDGGGDGGWLGGLLGGQSALPSMLATRSYPRAFFRAVA